MISVAIPVPSVLISVAAQQPHADYTVKIADDRLDIQGPGYTLKVAEDNEIPIRVLAPGLIKLFTSQTQFAGGLRTDPRTVPGTDQEVQVLSRAGASYIKIKPMQLGEVELYVAAKFADGAIAQRKITLMVGLPDRRPQAIVVSNNQPPVTNPVVIVTQIFVGANEQKTVARLRVGAAYEDTVRPIALDASRVAFHVKSSGDGPVLRIEEESGRIIPIRAGHALVETTFEGVTNRTCVIVAPGEASNSNPFICNDLLLPGQKLSFNETRP